MCSPSRPACRGSTATGSRPYEASTPITPTNLTLLSRPSGSSPGYADNPDDEGASHETFLTTELLPWVTENLARTGDEQSWLIGFSKSGMGATTSILRNPDRFTLAAAWDFPANLSSYDEFRASSARSYGTNDNFLASYRLTPAFLARTALRSSSRTRLLDRQLRRVRTGHDRLRRPPHRDGNPSHDGHAAANAAPLGAAAGYRKLWLLCVRQAQP